MRSKACLAAVHMPQADMHSLAANSWPNGHRLPKYMELSIRMLDSNWYLHLCHYTVNTVYSDYVALIVFLNLKESPFLCILLHYVQAIKTRDYTDAYPLKFKN
jgi:hypothetical protein